MAFIIQAVRLKVMERVRITKFERTITLIEFTNVRHSLRYKSAKRAEMQHHYALSRHFN
jgi:hypothetical protein